ncbi:MAG: AMP-binding protein [Chitinophagaceae bacterium]|nr:AMP-binding protein [Oligoflexus sp.]
MNCFEVEDLGALISSGTSIESHGIAVRSSWNTRALLSEIINAWHHNHSLFVVNPALFQLNSFQPFLDKTFLDQLAIHLNGFAVLLATSATSGYPKIVALDRSSVQGNVKIFSDHLGLRDARHTVVLHVPLFHAFGLVLTALQALLNGHRLVVFEKFSAKDLQDFLSNYQRDEPIFLPFVPSQLRMLGALPINEPLFLGKGMTVTGGDRLMKIDIVHLQKLFPNLKHTIGYGLTEAGPALCHTRLGQKLEEGMVGSPLPGIRLTDQPDGIAFQSPHAGLFSYNTETSKIEFLRNNLVLTGDSLALKGDSYHFTGRMKNIIKKNGETIFPAVLESYYSDRLPEGHEVFCLAYSTINQAQGEGIGLITSGGAPIDPKLIKNISRDLPAFYRPSRFLHLETIPQNALGKVVYPALRVKLEKDGKDLLQ